MNDWFPSIYAKFTYTLDVNNIRSRYVYIPTNFKVYRFKCYSKYELTYGNRFNMFEIQPLLTFANRWLCVTLCLEALEKRF